MTQIDLSQLTNEQLDVELKKRKQGYIICAFIVGMMMGCAFWVLITKGFTWYVFVPFVFAYWFRNAKSDCEEVKNEIENRI